MNKKKLSGGKFRNVFGFRFSMVSFFAPFQRFLCIFFGGFLFVFFCSGFSSLVAFAAWCKRKDFLSFMQFWLKKIRFSGMLFMTTEKKKELKCKKENQILVRFQSVSSRQIVGEKQIISEKSTQEIRLSAVWRLITHSNT